MSVQLRVEVATNRRGDRPVAPTAALHGPPPIPSRILGGSPKARHPWRWGPTTPSVAGGPRGITLLEIMAALLIMAFAFIPIIGVIGTGATDTDVTNSYIFAQTTARTILENLLDNVPFECVRMEGAPVADLDGSNSEDHVARLDSTDYNVASFLALLGNNTDSFARGTLTDGRGATYAVKLLIFPMTGLDSDSPDPAQEITFQYLPRPEFELTPLWFTDKEYVQPGVARPYDYTPVPATTTTNARKLGVPMGTIASERYCLMKKFLLRIRWSVPANRERFLEIYTAKANLSKEDKN